MICFSNSRTRSTKEKRLHTTILSDIYNGASVITTCILCVLQYTPRTPPLPLQAKITIKFIKKRRNNKNYPVLVTGGLWQNTLKIYFILSYKTM